MAYPHIMRRLTAAAVLLLIIASGCQITEDLALGETGGRSTTIIPPDPFFTDLLEDFAGFLPEDEGPAMESIVSGYAADLIASGAAADASWEMNGESYTISFTYDSIMEFLMAYGAGNQSLLRAGSTNLTFHLGIENYAELRDMVPFLSDPNFEVYGPEYCNGMTEDEYLEMIGFVLGEDGPEAIRSGRIMIRIHVPGTITEVSGGIAEDSSTALLTFPVIDFLLLNTPVDFSVSWR